MTDKEHIERLHQFLDEIWLMYSGSAELRKRLMAAKFRRWEYARMTTDTELDILLEAQSSGTTQIKDTAEYPGVLSEDATPPAEGTTPWY